MKDCVVERGPPSPTLFPCRLTSAQVITIPSIQVGNVHRARDATIPGAAEQNFSLHCLGYKHLIQLEEGKLH